MAADYFDSNCVINDRFRPNLKRKWSAAENPKKSGSTRKEFQRARLTFWSFVQRLGRLELTFSNWSVSFSSPSDFSFNCSVPSNETSNGHCFCPEPSQIGARFRDRKCYWEYDIANFQSQRCYSLPSRTTLLSDQESDQSDKESRSVKIWSWCGIPFDFDWKQTSRIGRIWQS
jgi:hypothetical protein